MPYHARPSSALFAHAQAVLFLLLSFSAPADKVVSRYFREHRELGHADRAFIAELVFMVLRRKRSLGARCQAAGGGNSPRALLLAALLRQGHNLRELQNLIDAKEKEWLCQVKGFDEAALSPAERLDLPDWLFERLSSQMGGDETALLAQSLNQSAPLVLRVNTLKNKRESVLEKLAADGIAAEAGIFSPFSVRLSGKPDLARHPLFLDGSLEVQDEGSQMLGLLLNPKRGELIADFCAGAGGKTLLLGALMRNTGKIYAFDVSAKRLSRMKPRLARSGLSNIQPVQIESERDIKIKRLAGKLDRVLVDAPCSGLGTLRRNPDLKWRQSEESIAELQQKQGAILAAAATLLKPGGRLVYATCSLLFEENDGVVEAFLAKNPDFLEIPAHEASAQNQWPTQNGRLQLFPHRHGTDSFFAAVLERRKIKNGA